MRCLCRYIPDRNCESPARRERLPAARRQAGSCAGWVAARSFLVVCRNSDRKPNRDYRDGRRQNKTGFRPTRLRRRPDRSAHPVRDGARNFYRTCAASFHKKILHRAQVQYTIKYSLMVSVIFSVAWQRSEKRTLKTKVYYLIGGYYTTDWGFGTIRMGIFAKKIVEMVVIKNN